MLCPKCHGKRRIIAKYHRMGPDGAEAYDMIEGICDHCHGAGVIHCCDGEQEQPASRENAMLAATDCNPNDAGC